MLIEKALDVADSIHEYEVVRKSNYKGIHEISACVSTLANEVRNLKLMNESLIDGSALNELRSINEVLREELRIALNRISKLESK